MCSTNIQFNSHTHLKLSLDKPPTLSDIEREAYFELSDTENDVLLSLTTDANKLGFILQLVYFKASQR